MSQELSLSSEGLALIARFEGFQPARVVLPDGRSLIGHGHVGGDRLQITPAEAEALLREDLAPIEDAVRRLVTAPLDPGQFDALVSLAFSIGLDAFRDSDVLRRLNAGFPIAAADGFDAWRRTAALAEPAVLDALVRRRAAEKARFLSLAVQPAAPSALVKPCVDHAWTLVSAPARMSPDLPIPDPVAEEAERLVRILNADPTTAAALAAPEQPRPTPARSTAPAAVRPSPPRRDTLPLAALGAAGAVLVAIAGAGIGGNDAGAAVILLGVPGVLALLMAAFYLLKSHDPFRE